MTTYRKPYAKLRYRMEECGIDRRDISEAIEQCLSYVDVRFQRKRPWSMDDVYIICDMLKIPFESIPEYFPREG